MKSTIPASAKSVRVTVGLSVSMCVTASCIDVCVSVLLFGLSVWMRVFCTCAPKSGECVQEGN